MPARPFRQGPRVAAGLFAAACCLAQPIQPADEAPTFGTTVVLPSGLRGDIYYLRPGTNSLPKLRKMEPVGAIYTASLNIPPREFTSGFPGVTDRFEWFAIDYNGRFWIEKPGRYEFSLTSDDGSKLYIDNHVVIRNDHTHPPQTATGHVTLAGGIHRIRVFYFQGPRFHVALILQIAPPQEHLHIFSTDELRPPVDPADWKYGDPRDPQDPRHPESVRRRLVLKH